MGSRRIVGFAIGEHHDADLAYGALAMAVAVRGGKDAIAGVIMHTDQGSEYTAGTFRAACGRIGITQSMGRVGSALDNAVIEIVALHRWSSSCADSSTSPPRPRPGRGSRPGSRSTTSDRRHSSLGMRTPDRLRARSPTAPEAAA